MKAQRKRSKKDKDWVTGNGKIMLRLKPIKTFTRVSVPHQQPSRLQKFVKLFYDNQIGEVVVRVLDGDEIRLFDKMEVFSFSDADLRVFVKTQSSVEMVQR